MKTKQIILIINLILFFSIHLYSQNELDYYINKYTSQIPEFKAVNQFTDVYNANKLEAKSMAYDLKSMSKLNINTNDPNAILKAYKQKIDEINQYIIKKQEQLNEEFAGTALNIMDDFATDGSIDPVSAAIGILGSIDRKAQANQSKAQALKELDKKLKQHMHSAKEDILAGNSSSINELVQSAADAFSWAEEEYYLDFIDYFQCYNKNIEEQYDYLSTEWINNPCPDPQKSITLPNLIQSEREQYYHAARRKQKLYKKYKNESFRYATSRYASTAISKDPEYFEAYYLKATVSEHSAERFNNLLIANYLRPKDVEVEEEKNIAFEQYKNDFLKAIDEGNTKYLQFSIEHNLNGYIENSINKNMVLMMLEYDNADGLQLLLNQEAQQSDDMKERLKNLMAVCCIKNAGNSIERLCYLGVDANWRSETGVTPLKLAVKYKSVYSISKLIEQGADYERLIEKYKLSNKTDEMKLIAEGLLHNDAYYEVVSLYARLNNLSKSIEYLELAMQKGFNDFKKAESDPNMANIINTNEYKELKTMICDKRDGQRYKTVTIGNQVWMAENLAYKSYSGCWAYDDKQSNVNQYGYLYNWETAKKVCPDGWHLPSKSEFETLLDNYSGSNNSKANYKALVPNGNSGFSALCGGWHPSTGHFSYIGSYGYFWSSSSKDAARSCSLDINGYWKRARMFISNKSVGLSVRCLQD